MTARLPRTEAAAAAAVAVAAVADEAVAGERCSSGKIQASAAICTPRPANNRQSQAALMPCSESWTFLSTWQCRPKLRSAPVFALRCRQGGRGSGGQQSWREVVQFDEQNERPAWQLTCYGHEREAENDLTGDSSFEELRWQQRQAAAAGATSAQVGPGKIYVGHVEAIGTTSLHSAAQPLWWDKLTGISKRLWNFWFLPSRVPSRVPLGGLAIRILHHSCCLPWAVPA